MKKLLFFLMVLLVGCGPQVASSQGKGPPIIGEFIGHLPTTTGSLHEVYRFKDSNSLCYVLVRGANSSITCR